MKNRPIHSDGGTYAIVHIATARRYAGCTNNLARRFAHHRTRLRNGFHHNKVLQRDWATHGESAFKFEIVERFKNKNDESRRWGAERTLINSCDPALSYNVLNADECRQDGNGLWLKSHVIKLHDGHWVAFEALGGVDWLRKLIDRAKPPKD